MECGAGGCGGKGVRVCIAYRRLSCARHAHGSRRFGIGAVDARGPRATRRLITLWSAPGGFPEFWRMTFLISARLMLLCLLDWPRRAPLSSPLSGDRESLHRRTALALTLPDYRLQ